MKSFRAIFCLICLICVYGNVVMAHPYFDNSSEMIRGWVTINGLTYYFNNDGCMATGTTIIDGVTHYFDAVGAKVF